MKSEEATASVEADLKAIQALITQSHGGYTALNEAVKVRLRSWFQDIAGTIEAVFFLGTFEGLWLTLHFCCYCWHGITGIRFAKDISRQPLTI